MIIMTTIAVLTSGLMATPASAEFQSGTSAVGWTVRYCPENPLDPSWIGMVHPDCWYPITSKINHDKTALETTATAPIFGAYNAVYGAAMSGEELETSVPTWAWGLVAHVYDQVDTLLGLVEVKTQVETLDDGVHVGVSVRAPGHYFDEGVTVRECTAQCAQEKLNAVLAGCLGCLSTMSASGTSRSPTDDSITNFEHRRTVVLTNDPNKQSGGPGKADGRNVFHYYVQSYKVHEIWNYAASSQKYSVHPINGCKIKEMTSTFDGNESLELIGWDPGGMGNYGSAGSIGIEAGLASEKKGISFSVGRTWNISEGTTGGMVTSNSQHIARWTHSNKKGTSQAREVSGVETWRWRSGQAASWWVGGMTTVAC